MLGALFCSRIMHEHFQELPMPYMPAIISIGVFHCAIFVPFTIIMILILFCQQSAYFDCIPFQVFAMPETALGLFPDVGASFFLSRLPGFFGKNAYDKLLSSMLEHGSME